MAGVDNLSEQNDGLDDEADDVFALESQAASRPIKTRKLRAANGGGQVELTHYSHSLEQHAERGWVSAIVTYSAVDTDGNLGRSLQNRLSWFLTRSGGLWIVAHEHASAPIGFESQKAILHRS